MTAEGEVVATDEIVRLLASLSMFADLSRPDLEGIAHSFEEEWFDQDQRIIRQGFSGTGFYVVIEGEGSVRIDGEERDRIVRGDFFGEMSILMDEPPVADVVALTPLRCLVLARGDLEKWLLSYPTVMFRMLQTELHRLRHAHRWQI